MAQRKDENYFSSGISLHFYESFPLKEEHLVLNTKGDKLVKKPLSRNGFRRKLPEIPQKECFGSNGNSLPKHKIRAAESMKDTKSFLRPIYKNNTIHEMSIGKKF